MCEFCYSHASNTTLEFFCSPPISDHTLVAPISAKDKGRTRRQFVNSAGGVEAAKRDRLSSQYSLTVGALIEPRTIRRRASTRSAAVDRHARIPSFVRRLAADLTPREVSRQSYSRKSTERHTERQKRDRNEPTIKRLRCGREAKGCISRRTKTPHLARRPRLIDHHTFVVGPPQCR
uniref:Uncharacterized protein n=1 Tax=Plectus sambesii TaxID=2011161 RepID=A0A914V4C1_9BILA